jgi:hypothetical protein
MWQAPPYCFETPSGSKQIPQEQQQQQQQQQQLGGHPASILDGSLATGRLLRPLAAREGASREQ